MDGYRIVAGLDVYKDSVFLYIMRYDEAIIFGKNYRTQTTDLRQMRDDMFRHGVTECAATSIIVETGDDMSMFAKVTNLVGWCGLKPRNDESNIFH